MIFQTEKQLKEYGDKIPEDKKKPIEEAIAELKKAHASKDIPAIDSATEKLNTVFQAASQDMYNTKGEETADPNQEEGDTSKKEEEVTDVDFEEV